MTVREGVVALRGELVGFARKFGGTEDDAHDAIVNMLAASASFVEGTNFKAWAFTILRNTIITRKRHENVGYRRGLTEGVDPSVVENVGCDPVGTVRIELVEVVRAAAQMSVFRRDCLVLITRGLTYDEAARVLGVPVGTVKSATARARRVLRECA